MAGKNNRLELREISNMSTDPYRTPETKQIFKTNPPKLLILSLSCVVEHPHHMGKFCDIRRTTVCLCMTQLTVSVISHHNCAIKKTDCINVFFLCILLGEISVSVCENTYPVIFFCLSLLTY